MAGSMVAVHAVLADAFAGRGATQVRVARPRD